MSYHHLGVTNDDLSNPNSSWYQGPACSGGQWANATLESLLNDQCKKNGAGVLHPDDNTVHPALNQPNTWNKTGTCTVSGGRVAAQVRCAGLDAYGVATVGAMQVNYAYYTPPGFVPGAPPEPTVKCPNGPPQPKGKCCPAGYTGTAPNCTPIKLSVTGPMNTSGNVVTDTTNVSGRPGPASTGQPTGINYAIFQTQPMLFQKAQAAPTNFNPNLPSAVQRPSGDGEVTVEPPPPSSATGNQRQKLFVGACIAVAVVSIGAMGWAWHSSR